MNCAEVSQLSDLYIRKELEPFTRKQIEKHLESCFICQNEIRTLNQTLKIINSVKVPPLPRDYSKIIIAGLTNNSTERKC